MVKIETGFETLTQTLRALIDKIDKASGAPTFTALEHNRLQKLVWSAEKQVATFKHHKD